MKSLHSFLIFISLVGILSAYTYKARSLGSSTSPAQQLDLTLQGYGFSAFVRPHTGVVYDATVPLNLTGIKVSVVRLRSGSLWSRGVKGFKEFGIPVGVLVHPYVERLALVYQNLGNWSSVYYPLPGFTYLAPVVGLLAYDAANLSANNFQEIDFVASKSPISINFTNVVPVPTELTPQCVWFNLDGLPEFRELVTENVCSTYQQGHFSIVVNSTRLAPPAPIGAPTLGPSPSHHKKHNSKVWKIVAGVVGGFIGLLFATLLLVWLHRYKEKKEVAKMEQHAEIGETLQMTRIGNAQAPVASGMRTQPMLENEYVA
ncbi:hypothetical protein J5N97_017424 [Dioscorea zingiberensis]|uniref:Transmembrane protein n=1 Tax=Dioscorea zingiberensis TaxID=325984 RepID=A0A9D5CMD9_9LILI|nr:hypothetical protein J5N97_017424 [Dioscorea zingiberensis]